jgi:glutaredoxin
MKKIIIASLFLSLALTGCSLGKGISAKKILTPDEAKAKAADFITKNLVSQGTNVDIKEITAEGSLYKLKVSVSSDQGSQDIDSYISNDGESFFPQVINIADTENQNQPAASTNSAPSAVVTNKTDKPVVELFVMSYCPYGTQIEKGIIPVVEALGDKIDFQLKFCDYTMHGAQETDENTKDYCIQKEQPDKLLSYLSCFLKEGNSVSCSKEVGLDDGKINSCIAAATKEFNIDNKTTDFAIYKTDNQKYGVSGSPTLVINGAQISSGRDSASLLNTICSGFNNAPAECSQQLSSQTPAPGFGTGTTAGGSDASCN